MEYLVRIIRKDGTVSVVRQSHSQFCKTIEGAPRPMPKGFYNGDCSVDCNIGNVAIVNEERLARAKRSRL